jgi:hypothetical protein
VDVDAPHLVGEARANSVSMVLGHAGGKVVAQWDGPRKSHAHLVQRKRPT